MNLSQSLRLGNTPCVAFVGAGGKTTALLRLARELPPPVIITATTHLHVEQIRLADTHWVVEVDDDLIGLEKQLRGVMLITGPIEGERTTGIKETIAERLHAICDQRSLPLLIEADGSRQHPLKAPAEHEPVIPNFVSQVLVVAGMNGLGKPLTAETVHRPEVFSLLSGVGMNEIITPLALSRLLTHPMGGLKGIPANAKRVALLNQSDTPELAAQASSVAENLLPFYHAVITASLNPPSTLVDPPLPVQAIREPVAAIILAAGEAKRFGQPKQLLSWGGEPLIQHIIKVALKAKLSPVVVVTGAAAERVGSAVRNLAVEIHHNRHWRDGQSTSLQVGLKALPPETGAAIFLLADQPMVTPNLLAQLVERHSIDLSPVVAPLVQNQRANPVLFDRVTFPHLMLLKGDVGGRAVFSKFQVTPLPWSDEKLLIDIDTPEDYASLQP